MMTFITGYLEQTDPEAAEAARRAWVTFEPFARDIQADGGDINLVPPGLEEQIITYLLQGTGSVEWENHQIRRTLKS
jgi:hypothetical protein